MEVVRSFIVFKEQGVISWWRILGLAGTKMKFQASTIFWFQPLLGSMSLWSAVFILWWSTSCKKQLSNVFQALCVYVYIHTKDIYKYIYRYIYIFQGTGSLGILLCGRIIVKIVTHPLPQQLFFVSTSSHYPIINSWVSLLLQKQGHRGLYMVFMQKLNSGSRTLSTRTLLVWKGFWGRCY